MGSVSLLDNKDGYLLRLSRYIHRNPIETKPPLVHSLDIYPWSSYPAYINHTKAPNWLSCACIYDMLGHHQKYQGYRTYVEAGVDEAIKQFYHRGNTASVLGDQACITWVRENRLPEVDDRVLVAQVLPGTLAIDHIIHSLTSYGSPTIRPNRLCQWRSQAILFLILRRRTD